MECAGNGRAHIEPHVFSQPWLLEAVGTARWRGVSVAAVLEDAGVRDGAAEVLFTGLDRGIDGGEEQLYERSLTLDEVPGATRSSPTRSTACRLPPQHGYPLRLVVPGWYGMTSVKWLSQITVREEPFDGYQMRHAYRVRYEEDEPGEPITTIAPRSLMVPPGIPEFRSRVRLVESGPCEIVGRAWSGGAEVSGVDFSADGGETWSPAELGDAALGRWAWRAWRFSWEAESGEHELCCRAQRRGGERAAARALLEPRRLSEQRGPARQRHRDVARRDDAGLAAGSAGDTGVRRDALPTAEGGRGSIAATCQTVDTHPWPTLSS